MKRPMALDSLACGAAPLVVGVISSERTLAHLDPAAKPPFDVAEFRVDLFGVDSAGWLVHAEAFRKAGIPVLLTLRHKREGGHWYRDEDERGKVYREALPYVSAIDVEIHSDLMIPLARSAREAGRVVIGSYHDFHRTPTEAELDAVIREGFAAGADVVKIAAFAHAPEDLDRLRGRLDVFPDRHLSLLGMGPLGPDSRVHLACAGSCLTYGFVDESSAPGQLSAAKLRERLIAECPAYSALARDRK